MRSRLDSESKIIYFEFGEDEDAEMMEALDNVYGFDPKKGISVTFEPEDGAPVEYGGKGRTRFLRRPRS